MSEKLNPAFGLIGNALKSTAADHVVAVTSDLYDEEYGLYQSEINKVIAQGGGESSHFFMTKEQYNELVENGSVEIDGELILYSDKSYYAIYDPEEE